MNYADFLNGWHQVTSILIIVTLGLAIFNYVLYKISFASKKTFKEKFDLASKKENRVFLTSHILLASALFFFNNTLEQETVLLTPVWFFIRLFVSASISVLYGYVAYLILKFYYPGKLDKKLKKLRYTPRVNPENGKKMKLLSEDEEDVYLDEGMQAEENVFSVDYDVWIDESTGYTKIEKYKGHLNALKCDRCGFQTLRLKKEKILRKPTKTYDGELLKEYVCSYCNRIKRKNVVLSKNIKEKKENAVLIADPLSSNTKISVIRIEIHTKNGEIKEFDFPNLGHAKTFLNEFDYKKLGEKQEVY
ncbi:MAG: hypothetical protein AAF620_10635 [Bacteroidota bacterium]